MNNILITGPPGSGKTTLVMRLAESLIHLSLVGFYTEEIRKQGLRQGFEIASLDGRRRTLAHTAFKGGHRVGKYVVDVSGFEDFLGTIDFTSAKAGAVVIDEIGKMECLSPAFIRLARGVLDSPTLLVATVSLAGEGFIGEVKARRDVELVEIGPHTRDSVFEGLRRRLRAGGK
ncbi:MAG: nucleoside-triphosphatase [Desulfomonilia bacterium]|jgi:nucleoside-triphosphatase|nr:nucleoside-triphosphatase [Pseudomonadota bacterium]